MARVRLDTLLAERGLCPSRTRAAASIAAGDVLVGVERRRAARPAEMVAPDVALAVAGTEPPVSRGGRKLETALDVLGVPVAGRPALDAGASTGGFTDVLLRRGAAGVIAVDVASDQLAPSLRADPRVAALDRVNARALSPAALPWVPEVLVADLSFISLSKVLPAVLGCLAPVFDGLVLVKPQFEVGRERVGRNGVVRSASDRRGALVAVASTARALGASVLGFASSGLLGPKGNRETFVWLAEGGRAGEVADVPAAAYAVEPDR